MNFADMLEFLKQNSEPTPTPTPTPFKTITSTPFDEFVAGFMYGITGNNNLTEIESCFTGYSIVYDFKKSLDSMAYGNFIYG